MALSFLVVPIGLLFPPLPPPCLPISRPPQQSICREQVVLRRRLHFLLPLTPAASSFLPSLLPPFLLVPDTVARRHQRVDPGGFQEGNEEGNEKHGYLYAF